VSAAASKGGSGVATASATGGVVASAGGEIATVAGAFVTSAQPTASKHDKAINPHRKLSAPNFVEVFGIGTTASPSSDAISARLR